MDELKNIHEMCKSKLSDVKSKYDEKIANNELTLEEDIAFQKYQQKCQNAVIKSHTDILVSTFESV